MIQMIKINTAPAVVLWTGTGSLPIIKKLRPPFYTGINAGDLINGCKAVGGMLANWPVLLKVNTFTPFPPATTLGGLFSPNLVRLYNPNLMIKKYLND